MNSHLRRISAGVLGLAIAALSLTACSSDEPGATPGPDSSAKLTKVKVGVLPNIDVAAIYLGEKQGYFEEEGIDIELVQAASGAAVVPSVVSGDFDFGFSNVAALLTASHKGLPLKIVSAGVYSTGESGNDIAGTVTREGSGIHGIDDLEGKTVAVTSLGGIFPLTINYLTEQAGIKNVRLVELGAADTPAALENGQVDAAVMSEPFLSEALGQGAVQIFSNFADVRANFMVAGYFATDEFVAKNADLVASFQKALNKAFTYANDNPDAIRDVLGDYTELSDETKQAVILPRYKTEIDVETLKLLSGMLLEAGQVDSEIDVNKLLIN